MAIFKGAGVAIVTPMNEDDTVNFDKLYELIDEQIAGGTDAIIICGTWITGFLSLPEPARTAQGMQSPCRRKQKATALTAFCA